MLATCGRIFADIQPTSSLWAHFHIRRNPLPNPEFPIDRPPPEAYPRMHNSADLLKDIKTI